MVAKHLTIFVTLLAFLAALTKAESVLDNFEGQQEAKTFFTSGGNYYLALNTTYLIYYGILAGLAALAALAIGAAFFSGGGKAQSSSYGSQNSGYNSYQRQGQNHPDPHERLRRWADSGKDSNMYRCPLWALATDGCCHRPFLDLNDVKM